MGLRTSEPFKSRVSYCPLDLPNTSLLAFKARHHGNFLSGADATGCRAQCETWAPHSSGGNPTVVIFFWLLVTVLGMWVLVRTHLFSSSASQCGYIYIYIYIYSCWKSVPLVFRDNYSICSCSFGMPVRKGKGTLRTFLLHHLDQASKHRLS